MDKTIEVRDMFTEDTDCERCLHYHGKSRYRKHGCKRSACVLIEENLTPILDGRIKKRKRGGEKWRE